jgi:hypothetical protein
MERAIKKAAFLSSIILLGSVFFIFTSFAQAKINDIQVIWNQKPILVKDTNVLLNNNKIISGLKKYNKDNNSALDIKWLIKNYKVYKIGSIKNGTYKGKILYMFSFAPDGPALRDNYFRAVFSGGAINILSLSSPDEFGDLEKYIFDIDKSARISNLFPAKSVAIPNTQKKLFFNKVSADYVWMDEISHPRRLYKFSSGWMYQDDKGCFLTLASDGTVLEYRLDLNFVDSKNRNDLLYDPQIFHFVWANGSQNKIEYMQRIVGCGINCLKYADYIKNGNQLKEVGRWFW